VYKKPAVPVCAVPKREAGIERPPEKNIGRKAGIGSPEQHLKHKLLIKKPLNPLSGYPSD
jgi:hypothetical protein